MSRLLLLAALGCAQPTLDTDESPKGIEITGYLDASRVGVSLLDDLGGSARADVLGLPGATGESGEISIRNDTSGTELIVQVAADGSFVGRAEVNEGDALVVARVDGNAEALALSVQEQPAFPGLADQIVHGPDPQGQATVELTFLEAPAADLSILLTSELSHEVVVMDVIGLTAEGTIAASSGHLVVVHGFHATDGGTSGVELLVP